MLVSKTQDLGMSKSEKFILQISWAHGHSLSKQTPVSVAQTQVFGLSEREREKFMLNMCRVHG